MGTLCRERGCKVNAKRKKVYSRKFQLLAVEHMRTCANVNELAKELGVTRRCLYKWRAKFDLMGPGEESVRPNTREASYRRQVRQLERLLAEKTLEVDFFKGALQKIEARRQKRDATGGTASTSKSEK
jgi:transposase